MLGQKVDILLVVYVTFLEKIVDKSIGTAAKLANCTLEDSVATHTAASQCR